MKLDRRPGRSSNAQLTLWYCSVDAQGTGAVPSGTMKKVPAFTLVLG